jgi:hypothetical protein
MSSHQPQVVNYGHWQSPLQPEDFNAAESLMLTDLETHRRTGKVYVLELRASDGRGVIVEYASGKRKEVLPPQYNCLSSVHEYGGASFAVSQSTGHIVFTDFTTRGVYGLDPDTLEVIPILDANEKIYYADFDVHPIEAHRTVAVRERHDIGPEIANVINELVTIDSSTKKVEVFATGADFYVSLAMLDDAADRKLIV